MKLLQKHTCFSWQVASQYSHTHVHTLNNCEFPDWNYSYSEVSGGKLKIPQKQSLNELGSLDHTGKYLWLFPYSMHIYIYVYICPYIYICMDKSDLTVFSLSHNYKLQSFAQLQIIKLGKIKYNLFYKSDLAFCMLDHL